MSDWKKTNLGKVCAVLSGGTPSTEEDGFWNGDLAWITPKDLSGFNGVYIERGTRNITKDGLKNSSAQLLPVNTILFSSRAPIGYVAIAKKELTTNQGFKNIVCDEKITHFRFIYYWLKYRSDFIEKLSSGSTFSEASASLMRSLEINLPPIEEQKEIAGVLSSLDNKIDLLREENKIVEATAQTIFKEWFVNFNFPNAEGKPYKSSGGKMINSELGEIPDGWRVEKLDDFVIVISGYAYSGDELVDKSDEALVTLKSFDRDGGFQVRGFKPFKGDPKLEHRVEVGDLVVAHTDLTQAAEVLGNPAFVFSNGGFEKMYITMDLAKIVSKTSDIGIGFLYFLMKTHSFKRHCVGYSNGTTVLHMSRKAIPNYRLSISGDLSLFKRFSDMADANLKKIIENNSQIQTLSTLRDTLLPKLIGGSVRIKYSV